MPYQKKMPNIIEYLRYSIQPTNKSRQQNLSHLKNSQLELTCLGIHFQVLNRPNYPNPKNSLTKPQSKLWEIRQKHINFIHWIPTHEPRKPQSIQFLWELPKEKQNWKSEKPLIWLGLYNTEQSLLRISQNRNWKAPDAGGARDGLNRPVEGGGRDGEVGVVDERIIEQPVGVFRGDHGRTLVPEKNKSGFPAKGLELWEGSKTRRQWLRRLWGVSGFAVRGAENQCADLIDDVGRDWNWWHLCLSLRVFRRHVTVTTCKYAFFTRFGSNHMGLGNSLCTTRYFFEESGNGFYFHLHSNQKIDHTIFYWVVFDKINFLK